MLIHAWTAELAQTDVQLELSARNNFPQVHQRVCGHMTAHPFCVLFSCLGIHNIFMDSPFIPHLFPYYPIFLMRKFLNYMQDLPLAFISSITSSVVGSESITPILEMVIAAV